MRYPNLPGTLPGRCRSGPTMRARSLGRSSVPPPRSSPTPSNHCLSGVCPMDVPRLCPSLPEYVRHYPTAVRGSVGVLFPPLSPHLSRLLTWRFPFLAGVRGTPLCRAGHQAAHRRPQADVARVLRAVCGCLRAQRRQAGGHQVRRPRHRRQARQRGVHAQDMPGGRPSPPPYASPPAALSPWSQLGLHTCPAIPLPFQLSSLRGRGWRRAGDVRPRLSAVRVCFGCEWSVPSAVKLLAPEFRHIFRAPYLVAPYHRMATTLVRVSARLAATSPSTGVIAPPRRRSSVQVDRLMTMIMQHAGLRAECMLTMVSSELYQCLAERCIRSCLDALDAIITGHAPSCVHRLRSRVHCARKSCGLPRPLKFVLSAW